MDTPAAGRRTTPPAPAERLDRERQAAPQVFERLRSMIIALDLPPGSPLSRAALATQFGVSSTPIRDALMRLAEEGLVDVFPQHATVVSRIDVKRAQQAHFLRQALELEIVRILALANDKPLVAALDQLITRQQQCAKAGDFESFMAADNDFHAELLWIPVASYDQIGKPGAARAVGRACATNPVPVVVPCHRVVASGGPGGVGLGMQAKRTLLAIEGVDLDQLPARTMGRVAVHARRR